MPQLTPSTFGVTHTVPRVPSSLRQAIVAEALAQSDEELLNRFQRAAFGYFLEQFNPENGLVADRSRAGAPASIAEGLMGR
jgi:hypothetical protein